MNGSISRLRDQINIPAGDATEEEILTRQREPHTDFDYFLTRGFRIAPVASHDIT